MSENRTVTAVESSRNVSIIGSVPVTLLGGSKGAADAFGRLRVSEPETLFDSKQIFDNQPLFWDDQEVSGGSTSSTHSVNEAASTIGVGATTAGRRIRQTFQRFNYLSGKSQLSLLTFVLDDSGGGTGITRGVGLYDDNNGLFLKDDEGTIKLVRRTYVTGSAVDNEVEQSAWNLDVMDGTGASGITIDFTKTHILVIDFEWLGVGRARMGFNIDGVTHYVHEFLNANNLSLVYMSTPNLPFRYEIENDGTGAASTLMHICSAIMSEGGVQNLGVLRHADSSAISGLSSGVTYAMLGIRLKTSYIASSVLIENISMISTTNHDQLHWELRINPTIAGTFTYLDQTNSAVQTATGSSSNTVTGGIEIDGGYLSTNLPLTDTIPNALKLGSAIDGTRDEIVLCARPITNNITVEGSLTWRELS